MFIPSFPVFLNQFLHPRWCLARFLPFNAGTNPPVYHHETRPLEPCAEIATAEAAMADEDGGNKQPSREAMDMFLSCFWVIKRDRTVSVCCFLVP